MKFSFKLFLENDKVEPYKIEGWDVIFVDKLENFDFNKFVEQDKQITSFILQRINQIIPAKNKVPIVCFYVPENAGDVVKSTIPKGYDLPTSDYDSIQGFAMRRSGTQQIKLFRKLDIPTNKLADIIIHEIGHHIYGSLNPRQQTYIAQIAEKYPAPSKYGDTKFKYADKEKVGIPHEAGDEFFAELLAKVIFNNSKEVQSVIDGITKGVNVEPVNWNLPYPAKIIASIFGMLRSVSNITPDDNYKTFKKMKGKKEKLAGFGTEDNPKPITVYKITQRVSGAFAINDGQEWIEITKILRVINNNKLFGLQDTFGNYYYAELSPEQLQQMRSLIRFN